MKGVSGIYLITNLINGRQYVGMSNNVRRRFWEHRSKSKDSDFVIYKAIRKYGIENFKIVVLEEVTDIDMLPSREVYWIEKLRPRYNMNKGGRGNSRKLSDELKEKLRSISKQQWKNKSEEEKQRIITNNLTGPKSDYVMPESHKQRLRELQLGRKQSQETCRKKSEKNKISLIGNQNRNKPVVCFLNGVKITEYPSTKIASLNVGVDPACITGVLKGRRKTAGGYNWKYLTQIQ